MLCNWVHEYAYLASKGFSIQLEQFSAKYKDYLMYLWTIIFCWNGESFWVGDKQLSILLHVC